MVYKRNVQSELKSAVLAVRILGSFLLVAVKTSTRFSAAVCRWPLDDWG